MPKSLNSFVALLIVICLQITFTFILFYPYIIKWGATEEIALSSLPGDTYAPEIRSTRAIDIHSSQSKVWNYLINMGADRDGFYSYILLEYLFGCNVNTSYTSKNNTLDLGRLVPIKSMNEAGEYTVGFKVVEIIENKTFVLDGWGTFVIQKTGKHSIKLIIRTHGNKSNNFIEKIGHQIFDVSHYIMEKRMMLGIKDLAETNGKNYTSTTDLIWLFTIVLSILMSIIILFITTSYYKILIPTITFLGIQYFVLVLDPKPYLGLLLSSIIVGIVILVKQYNKDNIIKRAKKEI